VGGAADGGATAIRRRPCIRNCWTKASSARNAAGPAQPQARSNEGRRSTQAASAAITLSPQSSSRSPQVRPESKSSIASSI